MKYKTKALKNLDIHYNRASDRLVVNFKDKSNHKPYLVKKPGGIYFSCNNTNDEIVALEIQGFSKKTIEDLNKFIPIKIDYNRIRRKFKLKP
jgi:hypothetical protein